MGLFSSKKWCYTIKFLDNSIDFNKVFLPLFIEIFKESGINMSREMSCIINNYNESLASISYGFDNGIGGAFHVEKHENYRVCYEMIIFIDKKDSAIYDQTVRIIKTFLRRLLEKNGSYRYDAEFNKMGIISGPQKWSDVYL